MKLDVREILKSDVFGRVEKCTLPRNGSKPEQLCILRVADGSGMPGSGWLARKMLNRERQALKRLEGLENIPKVMLLPGQSDDAQLNRRLLREHLDGVPLWQADNLRTDYFDRLRELVQAIHARGVCHNDLHKEQNLLVRADGSPALIDFQLASIHIEGTKEFQRFETRCAEDLRHVDKHQRRYFKYAGTQEGAPADIRQKAEAILAKPRVPRSRLAHTWRKFGKPVYNTVFSALGLRDREPRRPSSGPWPAWIEPSV